MALGRGRGLTRCRELAPEEAACCREPICISHHQPDKDPGYRSAPVVKCLHQTRLGGARKHLSLHYQALEAEGR